MNKMRINEIRKFIVFRDKNIDSLFEQINDRVESDGIKILNYDIREERGQIIAIVFYAEFD